MKKGCICNKYSDISARFLFLPPAYQVASVWKFVEFPAEMEVLVLSPATPFYV